VHSIVSAGRDPIAVPEDLVVAIQQRGNDGVVELPEAAFVAGQDVRIVDGPFAGFQGIFDRYLSGTQRVAILLRTVETVGLRIVLPKDAVIHEDKYRS
jgi:transcriptional antiterminator RfaH